jgi:hypothetical protein
MSVEEKKIFNRVMGRLCNADVDMDSLNLITEEIKKSIA